MRRGYCLISRWMGMLLCGFLAACATGTYTPPKVLSEPNQFERVLSKSFDQTWTALVDYASGAFYSIDQFEKDSGLMTLSFGSDNPEQFIDCGYMKASNLVKSVDMPYAQYLVQTFGARLDGKINILVKPVESDKTLVRVNARYIFSVPSQATVPAQSWVFDSGSQAKIAVRGATPGTIPTRTCRPTYEIEKAILDALDK